MCMRVYMCEQVYMCARVGVCVYVCLCTSVYILMHHIKLFNTQTHVFKAYLKAQKSMIDSQIKLYYPILSIEA